MRMPFGKKAKSSGGKTKSSGGKTRSPGSRPERTPGLKYDNSDESLPGICGYLNGQYVDSDHPSRFRYRRPDGRDDDGPADLVNEDLEATPLSRRRMPRGFFGT